MKKLQITKYEFFFFHGSIIQSQPFFPLVKKRLQAAPGLSFANK